MNFYEDVFYVIMNSNHFDSRYFRNGFQLQRDEYGQTPIYYWIKFRIKERRQNGFPPSLLYDGYKEDTNFIGCTPLMHYLCVVERFDSTAKLLISDKNLSQKDKNGRTALMYFIIYCQGEIPEDLLYDRWEIDFDENGDNALHIWIKNRTHDHIPDLLIYDGFQNDFNKLGLNALNLFSIHRNDSIISELLYDGYKQDNRINGNTAPMKWIQYGKSKEIPEYLTYEGWTFERNSLRQTPMMLWFFNRTQDIPDYLLYEGYQTDKDINGNTALMLFIINSNSLEFPKILLYPGFERSTNNDGNTPLMLWIEHRKYEDIPSFLLYEGFHEHKNKKGENPEIFWRSTRKNISVPSFLKTGNINVFMNTLSDILYKHEYVFGAIKYKGNTAYIKWNSKEIEVKSSYGKRIFYYDEYRIKHVDYIKNRTNKLQLYVALTNNDVILLPDKKGYFQMDRNVSRVTAIPSEKECVYFISEGSLITIPENKSTSFRNNHSKFREIRTPSKEENAIINGIIIGITYEGEIVILGYSNYLNRGRNGVKFKETNAVQIECGKNHAIVLFENGNVYGWGLNTRGQLFKKPNIIWLIINSEDFEIEPIFIDSGVMRIAASGDTTAIEKNDGVTIKGKKGTHHLFNCHLICGTKSSGKYFIEENKKLYLYDCNNKQKTEALNIFKSPYK